MKEKKPNKLLLAIKTNRKLRLGTTATVLTAVVAAAVIVFNIVVGMVYDRFPLGIDLTEDMYTLSDTGRDVAKNVKQDVEIIVFAEEAAFSAPNYTEDYAWLSTVFRQFYVFTQEYGKLSGGRVTTKYLDIEANPKYQDEYSKYDITTGSILFRTAKHDRVITVNDLILEQVDSSTYMTNYSSLVDQKLAECVNAVCAERNVTLTFLTGHGEDETMISALQSLYKLNGYNVDRLNLSTSANISAETEAMVIVAPKTDFKPEEITALRSWLRNDDKLNRDLFVLCNYLGNCPNLYDFLQADYGITVTNEIIVETDKNNYMDITGNRMPITVISETDLTKDSKGKEVIMPNTLRLETAFGTDSEAEAVTNYPLVGFSKETAKLIPVSSLTNEGKEELKDAAENPIGMVYAKRLKQTSEHQGETNVIVSGTYFDDTVNTWFAEYSGEPLMLEPLRTVCSLGETVSISSQSLETEVISFSSAEALAIEIVMILLPVLLIIISLIVFLKRRHL